jgi:XTP/dITP diphosphohydrolase
LKPLFCATGNAGKLREFRLAAEGLPFAIDLLPGYRAIPPCIEDGATFEQNAIIKARHYAPHAGGPLFADDSGLEVDALGGAPGVRSARFSGEGASDEANNRLLLERLRGAKSRTARFVCAIALVEAGQVRGVWRGTVEGLMLEAARGANGFGYDPLFFSPALGCTFGEADDAQKFQVSHRGQALRAMLRDLYSPDTAC